MKKSIFRSLLCLVLTILSIAATAQEVRTFDFNHGKTGIRMTEQTRGNVNIEYSIDKMSLTSFTYNGEEMQSIGIADISLPNEKGLPNVPSYSRTIAIPQGAQAVLRVKSYEQQVIKNVNVEPSLGVQAETEEPNTDYVKDTKVYSENAFYPAEFASVSPLSNIRGVDVVNICINPVRFNPVTKEAIVYHNIDVEVEFVGGNGQFGDNRLRSPYFDPILAQSIMNYNSLPVIDYEARMQEWLRDGADGAEYIIVIPNNDGFLEPAQRLRDYRMQQGIITEVVRLDEMPATTTTEMKTWFHNAYNNWEIAPVAVLLFGDHNTNMAQGVPAIEVPHPSVYSHYGTCLTDIQYADVIGNDNLPEMVFSRLVAADATEATMMADKQIEYEYTSPNMDPNFYTSPITALGWQTERWFQLCSEVFGGYMRAHGYTPQRINCIYDGTPGNSWSSATNTEQVVSYFGPNGTNYIPASPSDLGGWTGGTPEQVVNAVNAGTFWVQHRDHGLDEGWGEPAVRNEHIDQLTNVGKMPFVMSINCQTGMYNYTGSNNNCFTEKWMRRTYNGQNAGAVGVISPTEISYSFVNDAFVWGVYDQFDPDFMPTYPTNTNTPAYANRGNWRPAFGNVAGKYFLAESSWPYNESSKDITYIMFTAHCDAFLRIYTHVPETMTVQHQNVQLAGLDQFQITAPEGAVIALTKGEGENLEVVAVATATGSVQNVTIPAQTPPTVLKLTVTAQNYLRYEADIEVIPASGPYLVVNEFELSNQVAQLNFGEQAGFDIQLKNVGNTQAPAGNITMTTESEYVTFINNSVDFSAINSDGTENITEACTFTISDEVPNKTNIDFLVTITSGDDVYESHIIVKAYAPVFGIGNVTITEITGNGNGRLDPGETVLLSFPVINKGNADSWTTDATLVINNPFMDMISEPTVSINSIAVDSTAIMDYEIYVTNAPEGFIAEYSLNVESGAYTATQDYTSKIGLNVEDFESQELDPTLWINTSSKQWTFDTENPYEGQFCMRSGAITHSQDTKLTLNMEVGGNDTIAYYYKVSSESGWDKMFFYIDETEMDNWSGEIDWTLAKYPISEGVHTFTWEYKKDGSVDKFEDCCWIDFVVMPRDRSLAVNAGVDHETCQGGVQLNGFVTNQTSMEWTTSGDGTFDDATIINPVYTPGTQDIENGSVTLTLTAYKGIETLSDDVTITFKPDVYLEPYVGVTACMGIINMTETYIVENADGIEYATAGDGTFDGDVYTFGPQDIANGFAEITVIALGCNQVSEVIAINYAGEASFTCADSFSTCLLEPVEITYSIENGIISEWTSDGTGTFEDAISDMVKIYSPSEADLDNGTVNITVSYYDCQGTTFTHNITVTLHAPATATGSEDAEICMIQPVEAFVNIENATEFLGWTTTGTGSINNPEAFSIVYTPSEGDFNIGTVVLTASYSDCTGTSTYSVTITCNGIEALPVPEGPTDVYNHDAVTSYTVNGDEIYISYSWILEPADAGTMVQDGNNVTITWDMNHPDTDVTLSVTGTTENCGSSESEALHIALRGHGINEINAADINIHPNPANDIINVSIENITADVQIMLYNSVGQVVYTKEESADGGLHTVISLDGLTNGAYILQIRSDAGLWTKRVIKE